MRPQKYFSCQLIAAINARIVLGMPDVSNAQFETLVDLVKCRYGAAIHIEKAYPKLNLKVIKGPIRLDWIKSHLPVALPIWDRSYGYHSILLYDFNQHTSSFKTHNAVRIKQAGVFHWQELKALATKHGKRPCKAFTLKNPIIQSL
ncbi:MAG: hypothetical protein V3W37_10035 [Candidatus Binatia bacterium]